MEMTLYIPEILELIENENSRNEKMKILAKYSNVRQFIDILKLAYDDSLVCKFDNKKLNEIYSMNYDVCYGTIGQTISTLYMEYPKLSLFFNGSMMIKKEKLEMVLLQIMEVIHPTEIEVVFKILRRENLCKGLTKNLVEKTFPNLL